MKCPLLGLDEQTRKWADKATQADCLKEEYAWWDEVTEQCCIKTLARGIVPIINDLKELVKKMPHAGQFLK